MALDGIFGRFRKPAPVEAPKAEQKAPEKSSQEKFKEGSIQAEMRFTFFNRPQQGIVGGDSLTEIADKVGGYIAELEMGPMDSVVKDFRINIPGHPEITDFPSLILHATRDNN